MGDNSKAEYETFTSVIHLILYRGKAILQKRLALLVTLSQITSCDLANVSQFKVVEIQLRDYVHEDSGYGG